MWNEILRVSGSSSRSEIRKAFKRRVLETHPDKGGCKEAFRQVMLAFEEASSGQRRKPIQKPSKKRGNRRLAIIESLHTCLKQLRREDRLLAISTKLREHHRVALLTWVQATRPWEKRPEAAAQRPRLPDAPPPRRVHHVELLAGGRRFRLHFPVHHWTGRGLRSPSYPIGRLREGLQVWQELQAARLHYSGRMAKRGGIFYEHSPAKVEEAWQRISGIFVALWARTGISEGQVRKKLELMRRRHEAQNTPRQLEAWNSWRMASEERRQREQVAIQMHREASERRRMRREDRRQCQLRSYVQRIFRQIERLLRRLDEMESRGRKRCAK